MKLVPTLLILTAIAALSYGEKYLQGGPNHPSNVKLQRSYMNYMDKRANPCSDFYQYACGNWSKYHEENQSIYVSVPEMLNNEVNMEFVQYMDNTPMDDKPEFVKNAHEFYASCIVVGEFKGLPIMKWLEEHENMEWILRMKTVEKNSTFDWVHTLGLMRKYGMDGVFVKETVYAKETDPSEVVVELSNPSVRIGFNHLHRFEMKQLNSTVELAEGVKPMMEFYNEIDEFEEILSILSQINEEKGKQVMKVKDLPVAWLSKYLAVVLENESLDANMEITINDIAYMEALDDILKHYDDAFLQRYLEVKFLEHINDNAGYNYEVVCIETLRAFMPLAMHWIYEQMHPELEQEIPKIHQMFDNILKFVNKTLRSDKSGVVPDTFLSKLDKMQLKVGNLPRQDTIKALDAFYANLSLTHKDYFDNYLQFVRFRFNIEHFLTTNDVLTKFNEFFDRTEDYGYNILPRYEPAVDVLLVPSYLVRPPIYHWAYHDLFKQSSLGSLMAYYVYSTLQMDGFDEVDMYRIARMGGVRTAYDVFFSAFEPENLSEHQTVVDVIDVSLKQMFFINAEQYYCKSFREDDVVNLVMPALPAFQDAFDCKNIHFRKLFEN